MDLTKFRNLSPHNQALIAISILLDGREGGNFLEIIQPDGDILKKIANQVAVLDPEIRMPLIGSMLRAAIERL